MAHGQGCTGIPLRSAPKCIRKYMALHVWVTPMNTLTALAMTVRKECIRKVLMGIVEQGSVAHGSSLREITTVYMHLYR